MLRFSQPFRIHTDRAFKKIVHFILCCKIPFMGVGSTGVAAQELGRRFAGCEIDKIYFEAAKNRIEGR